MNLEETVKELKADLKNARELIFCLTETVKAQNTGRNENLHPKLDELLKGREEQKELEMKVEALRAETSSIAHDVTKSKEIAVIIDTVQTTEGYAELFVKDFEKIQAKQEEIISMIGHNFLEMRQQTNLEISQIRGKLDHMEDLFVKKTAEIKHEQQKQFQADSQRNIETGRKIEEIEHKINQIVNETQQNQNKEFQPKTPNNSQITESLVLHFMQMRNHIDHEFEKCCKKIEDMNNLFDQKMVTFKTDTTTELQLDSNRCGQIEGKTDRMRELGEKLWKATNAVSSNIRGDQKKNVLSPKETKVESLGYFRDKPEIASKPLRLASRNLVYPENQELVFKCRNCLSDLPKNLPKLKDGVSVKCPKSKCGCINIVKRLEEGNKWMKGNCGHLRECPKNTLELIYICCHVCNTYSNFVDQKDRSALAC